MRAFRAFQAVSYEACQKSYPHLKMRVNVNNKPRSSSASLDLARPTIPMDSSIVWPGRGSILQVQLESNGQSPCVYERTRPHRHTDQLNIVEITCMLLVASIHMDSSIGARFLSRLNASQGHKSMQIASQSELQYAKFAQAGINRFPLSTAAGVGEATWIK